MVGVIIIVSSISVLAHFKITQIAASQVAARVQELNEALGEAIQLISGGQMGEPVNPLQGLLVDLIRSKVSEPSIEAKIVEKDDKGKFVKKIE